MRQPKNHIRFAKLEIIERTLSRKKILLLLEHNPKSLFLVVSNPNHV